MSKKGIIFMVFVVACSSNFIGLGWSLFSLWFIGIGAIPIIFMSLLDRILGISPSKDQDSF